MTDPAALTDLDAERAILASSMEVLKIAQAAFIETGLRPGMFYAEDHQMIAAAVLAIVDRGSQPTATAVVSEIAAKTPALAPADVKQLVNRVCAAGLSIGAFREHAKRVRDLSAWRARLAASHDMQAAIGALDPEALEQALARFAAAEQRHGDGWHTAEELTHRVADHVEGRVPNPKWTWPFHSLNTLTHGGLRPGQVTLISGPTRHGKSAFLDEVLEHVSREGAKVGLYLNEMDSDERTMRAVARGARIWHGKVINQNLTPTDHEKFVTWAGQGGQRFPMQECEGWAAADVARDARYRGLDIVALDMLDELPLMPRMTRRETAEESFRVLKQLALAASCHVFVLTHLNRNRSSQTAYIPLPALGDIRESGMIGNRSHNVLFVWQDQDADTGNPNGDGKLVLAKARAGTPGLVDVVFDGNVQTFREPLVRAA